MVGEKHQCKTSWMCGVIKTKSREISSGESVGCNEHNKLLTTPLSICLFLSPIYEKCLVQRARHYRNINISAYPSCTTHLPEECHMSGRNKFEFYCVNKVFSYI
jgi:hypothetical protein